MIRDMLIESVIEVWPVALDDVEVRQRHVDGIGGRGFRWLGVVLLLDRQ